MLTRQHEPRCSHRGEIKRSLEFCCEEGVVLEMWREHDAVHSLQAGRGNEVKRWSCAAAETLAGLDVLSAESVGLKSEFSFHRQLSPPPPEAPVFHCREKMGGRGKNNNKAK
ncbi:hypothetical protein EYF80_045401 [Liparis tanakae]|uniref:Uncharacterized protein n=1 Tax=Liparis tanakae TaxID=230148 RepID=A0A4Z2FTA5_9TELE|nr:hypothetical protein EYF80_045401 [Liparis tanakae]